MVSESFFGKISRYRPQNGSFLGAKAVDSHNKPTTFAVQNDRFYIVKALLFLHIPYHTTVNTQHISELPLHTHTQRKSDQQFVFLFFGEFWRANIVNFEF